MSKKKKKRDYSEKDKKRSLFPQEKKSALHRMIALAVSCIAAIALYKGLVLLGFPQILYIYIAVISVLIVIYFITDRKRLIAKISDEEFKNPPLSLKDPRLLLFPIFGMTVAVLFDFILFAFLNK